MTGLLVSVRSAAEAEAALAGGADIIDVKEPANGPLGFAGWDVIRDVVQTVSDRVPVSAALGELVEWNTRPASSARPRGVALDFVKWGLAWYARPGWCDALRRARRDWPGTVAVAYADSHRIGSPSPAEIAEFAITERLPALLIDTWGKDGLTLPRLLSKSALRTLMVRCREGGVRVALAGSLGVDQLLELAPLAPDWFAVRGAACSGGRGGTVDAERVRQLVRVIQNASAKCR